MPSSVDIVNLGYSNIGHRANVASISPPEPTVEAQTAQRFFPIALDETLAAFNWDFAMTRAELVELVDQAPASWEFAYAVPNGCLRIAAVLSEDATSDDASEKWIREGDMIFTNVENATLRYVQRITDANKFPPKFVISLAHRLGAYFSGVIIKGKEGEAVRDKQLKLAESIMGQAGAIEGNGQRENTYRDHLPAAIRARQ